MTSSSPAPGRASAVRTAGLVAGGAAAGFATAVCGLVTYRHVWRDGPVPLPWGLVLALATVVVVVRAAALVGGSPGGLGVAAGWFSATLWLQSPGPGGDFLLVSDALGYGFLYAGMLLVAGAVVTGSRTGRNRRT
ncbi:MAG: hypothetical protein M3419_03055 [Actinomycetota bacterium]|nr:hypothetical protein [Actinomycetota bacterium]